MSYFLLVLTTLFWSGNFVISRGMHDQIPPLALAFWRWTFALIILSFFALPHLFRQRRLVRQHIRFICIQGVLGVGCFNSLIYIAVQSTTAINAALVNSCIPVLIAVCSWLMFREVMSPRQWIGVLLSLGGVSLIVTRGDLSSLKVLEFNPGDLVVLLAALIWALYSANLKRYPAGLHPFAYLSGIVIVGLMCITPFYVLEMQQGQFFHLTWSTFFSICYVAIFASVLAFIFWNRSVRIIGANRAGPFIHLMPVFSSVLAMIFLQERMYTYHFLGIGLIFAGIALTTLAGVKGRG